MDVSLQEIDQVFLTLEIDERRCLHHRRGLVCDLQGHPLFPIHCAVGRGLSGREAENFISDLGLDEPEFRLLGSGAMPRNTYLALVKPRLG